MIYRFFSSCLIASFTLLHVCSQEISFLEGQYLKGETFLPYRYAVVGNGQYNSLAVFLHGGSACGNDNEAPLQTFLETNILPYIQQSGRAFHIFIPQCPQNRLWNENVTNTTPMSAILKNAIGAYVSNHNISPDHIYLFGVSAGGTGSWRMLSDNPHYFAGALIGAGSPKGMDFQNIATTPVYCVLSKADKVVKIGNSLPYVREIQSLPGAQITIRILEDADHQTTCKTAYTDDAMEQVLSSVRTSINSLRIKVQETARYNLLGQKISSSSHGISAVRYSDGTSLCILSR